METEQPVRTKSREDRAAGWAVLCIFGVMFVTWGAYLAIVVVLLLGHLPWLVRHLEPVSKMLAVAGGFGFLPLFLMLAAFSRTRLAAGMGFFAISGVFTFVTAAGCAMYTDYVWSWPGVLIGTILVGYGIIPTGILAALTHHRLDIAGALFSTTIMLFSAMYFGLTLMTLSFSAAPLRLPPAEDPQTKEVESDSGRG